MTTAAAAVTDLEALERANAGFIRAVAASDAGWFEEHLAPDFLCSNADGALVDRGAFLAWVARPFTLGEFGCEDVRVQVWDGFSVIHGRTRFRLPSGEPGRGRYTDVWMRRDGRWLCVAAHINRA